MATIAVLYAFRDNRVAAVIPIAIYLISAYFVVSSLMALRFAKRFYYDVFAEPEAVEELRQMTRQVFFMRTLNYSSANAVMVLIGLPCLIATLALGFNWLAVPVILLARLFYVSFRSLSPPLAVYLGASRRQQAALCSAVQHHIFPLRVINLLSTHMKGVPMRYQIDGARLGPDERWEEVVEKIMISVPIIILDTRDESSALAAERRIIHERRLYWKLVIVTQPGRSEDHFSNDLLAGEQIAWITPEDLPDTIFSSIVLRRRLPTQSHPAGPMLRPPGHDQRGPIGEA